MLSVVGYNVDREGSSKSSVSAALEIQRSENFLKERVIGF